MGDIYFYGLLDFYEKKEKIKEQYDLLTINEIIEYKLYVYSIPFEDENIKDLIWEYLNGWKESCFDLGKKYRIKKKKNDKRQELYDKKRETNNEV